MTANQHIDNARAAGRSYRQHGWGLSSRALAEWLRTPDGETIARKLGRLQAEVEFMRGWSEK